MEKDNRLEEKVYRRSKNIRSHISRKKVRRKRGEKGEERGKRSFIIFGRKRGENPGKKHLRPTSPFLNIYSEEERRKGEGLNRGGGRGKEGSMHHEKKIGGEGENLSKGGKNPTNYYKLRNEGRGRENQN